MIITCASLAQNLPKPKSKIEFVNSQDRVTFTENVIASTGANKNKTYFQIANFLKYKDKLNSIVFNFNHDLTLTNGQYLGNKTKMNGLEGVVNAGELEIVINEIVSTDPQVIAYADQITSYSTELTAEDIYFFENQEGLYANSFDWFGLAFLTGVLPNLSGSRVGNVTHNKTKKEKAFDISELLSNSDNIMNKEDFLKFLDTKEGQEIINSADVVSKLKETNKSNGQLDDKEAFASKVQVDKMFEDLTAKLTSQIENKFEVLNKQVKPEIEEGQLFKSGEEVFVFTNSKFEKLELVENEFLRTGVFKDSLENSEKVEVENTVESATEYTERKRIENSLRRAKLPSAFTEVQATTESKPAFDPKTLESLKNKL